MGAQRILKIQVSECCTKIITVESFLLRTWDCSLIFVTPFPSLLPFCLIRICSKWSSQGPDVGLSYFLHLIPHLKVERRLLAAGPIKPPADSSFVSYLVSLTLIFNWLKHQSQKAPPLNVLLAQLKAAAVPISNLRFGTWDWLPLLSKTASSTECKKAWKSFLACFS